MPKRLDLTGQTFGQLTVLRRSRVVDGHAMWQCKCSCGGQHEVRGTHLTIGATVRCGSCARAAASPLARARGITIYEWTYLQERASAQGMVPHVCGFAVAVDREGKVLAYSPFSKRPVRVSERFIRAKWVMGLLQDKHGLVKPKAASLSIPDWMGRQGIEYRPHPESDPLNVHCHRYWATEGAEWLGAADVYPVGLTPDGQSWVPSELQRMKLQRDQRK